MKYILPFISCFLVLMSCTKEGEYSAPEETVYSPKTYAFRAIRITGTNTHWGDFTLYLGYDKDELNSIIRTNTLGDTVGSFGIVRNSGARSLFLNDYVPTIDQDSILRLDNRLKEQYGSGNYSLTDSIPLTSQTLQELSVYLYTDGRIKKSVVKQYVPNPNRHATGKDFKYAYILSTTTSSTYEYNANSNVCVNRIIYDVHDHIDKDLYTRTLYKTETWYEDDRIMSMKWFKAKGGDNFTEYNRYNYTYNEKYQLTGIQGEIFSRKFTYNDNQVLMTTNDTDTVTYELDAHGNVVKIYDGNGNSCQIEYEPGNGNFSLFTLLTDRMLNPFFIK